MNQNTIYDKDIIQEVVNIGIGDAADALSKLVKSPVLIKVPDIEIIQISEVKNYIESKLGNLGLFIIQDFKGTIEGKVILSYSTECAKALLKILLNETKDIFTLSNIELSVLEEIGNILSGSCIASICNMAKKQVIFSLPYVIQDINLKYLIDLQNELEQYGCCIVITNEIHIKEKQINGYIFIIVSMKDIKSIIDQLKDDLKKLTKGSLT
ncbi:MAG: chemotaxis protein CheC [Desulfobacterales bacterium]|nr:chemotaxis protein CheC [Desulfobacterales bacterium]